MQHKTTGQRTQEHTRLCDQLGVPRQSSCMVYEPCINPNVESNFVEPPSPCEARLVDVNLHAVYNKGFGLDHSHDVPHAAVPAKLVSDRHKVHPTQVYDHEDLKGIA